MRELLSRLGIGAFTLLLLVAGSSFLFNNTTHAQPGKETGWTELPTGITEIDVASGFKDYFPKSWGRLVSVNTTTDDSGIGFHQFWFEASDGTIRLATGSSQPGKSAVAVQGRVSVTTRR